MARKAMTEEEKAAKKAAREAAEEKETADKPAETAEAARKEETADAKESVAADKNAENERIKVLEAMIQKQNEQIEALLQQKAEAPQFVQVVTPDTEKVQFLWQAEVAEENVQNFGQNGMYGRIVGKTGTFIVPKSDLSRVLDEKTRYFLNKRWLIVVSGLTEDEREALNVSYKEGEILDKKAFAKMVELEDKILEIYPNLCEGHKKMVAQRYTEAWEAKNPHVRGDVVRELNRMSKADENGGRGMFIHIIEAMNEEETA